MGFSQLKSLHSISDVEQLIIDIDQSDIVSFDIFDTLLLRNVIEPTDLFKAVELEYQLRNQSTVEFYHNRIKAEETARSRSSNEDVTYDEIYSCLQEKIGEAALQCKAIELELEKKFLIANTDMKAIYEYALKAGKQIYIISDMYLPNAHVEPLLQHNGYEGYHRLYISNEVKATKATGSIYRYIKKAEQIKDSTSWIHIGDNKRSDIENAKLHGLKTYYYKKLSEREHIAPPKHLGDSIVRAIQLNYKYLHNNSYWYQFGASVASSIYIGLMQWLVEQIKHEDHIYFLSRDGYFPYHLYSILREENPTLPEGKYIYASRRAYIYPYLLILDKSEAIDYLMLYNAGLDQRLTVREIMDNLGLDCRKHQSALSDHQIDSFDAVVGDDNSSLIKTFLLHIWSDIEAVLRKEKAALEQYFAQAGISEKTKLNIFDIGWSGSTQLAIKKMTNKPIQGYYFATIESMKDEIKNDAEAFAFHLGAPWDRRNFIIRHVMMYEFLFSAPEGSLINFTLNDKKESIANLKNVEKNDALYEALAALQNGATDVFREVLRYKSYVDTVSVEGSLHEMERFIRDYRVNDMLQFSQLTNSVGFGHSQDIKQYVLKVSLDDYLEERMSVKAKADFLLWHNALMIQDDQGRLFNELEIEKMYGLKNYALDNKLRRIFALLKKAIRNPKKAVKKALSIMKALMTR